MRNNKITLVIAFCCTLLIPLSSRAEVIDLTALDSLPGHKCGAPAYHEESIELAAKNLDKKLTRSEMIERGYMDAQGILMAPVVGDTKAFNVVDDNKWTTVTAELRSITAEAYIYVQVADRKGNEVLYDSGSGNGYITQADIDTIATEFSSVYTVNRNVFGNEPATGVDADSHVTILLLDIDSDYADYIGRGEKWWNSSWVAGYFYSIDTYPASQAGKSNESKIIYIDTYPTLEHGSYNFGTKVLSPAPTTVHDNDVGGVFINEGADASYSVIAHEFQHMIHFNIDANEEIWVEEGCSGFAEYINGYGHPGSVENFAGDPSNSLTYWGYSVTDYGNTYLFILYLYEQFGSSAATINSLVSTSANGTAGVDVVLGGTITLKEFFKNWLIANYLDDTTIAAEYGYGAINMSSYSTTGVRAGIDPVAGSSYGTNSVSSIAAEYVAVSYDSRQYISYAGNKFSPVVVGLNGTTVVSSSIADITLDQTTLLADFGGSGLSAYTSLILVNANTTSNNGGDYEYSFSAGSDGDGDSDGIPMLGGDCDDSDQAVYPGADEICGDGTDQNCDGSDGSCGSGSDSVLSGLCFIAAAAHENVEKPALFDKIIIILQELSK